MQAQDVSGRDVLPRSRKARAILAILALSAPHTVLRSRLTKLLWSQRAKEQARASLRQAVHELLLALGPRAGTLLRTDRNHLAMLDERLWVDVRVGAIAVQGIYSEAPSQRLILLDDLDGLDPAFDDWLGSERQRITQQIRSLAEDALNAASDVRSKVEAAERLLSIDRGHAGAWRIIIRARLDQGDHAGAEAVFRRYSASLSQSGSRPEPSIDLLMGPPQSMRRPLGENNRRESKGARLLVLPARPLSGRRSDALLPGLAAEITGAVSRFRWISCVAGGLWWPGDPNPRQSPTWREVDPDFVLDTTLQQSGGQLRALVHLIDVRAQDKVIWARRFDRQLADVLTLQSEIASETAAQIDPELLMREGERLIASQLPEPDAYDLTLQAIPAIYRMESQAFHGAGDLLSSAITLDPKYAPAYGWWAYWHLLLVGQAWAHDSVATTRHAGELAERAVTLDPNDARAVTLVGHVRGFLHKRVKEACALHEKALSLNPNLPLAWCFSGLALSYLGSHTIAIERIARAQHLSPHDPHAFFFDMARMMPHFLLHEFEQAAELGRRAVELNPGFSSTYKGYLATLGKLGQADEAAHIRERLLQLEPGFRIKDAVQRTPMMRAEDRTLYAEGLRSAGLPE